MTSTTPSSSSGKTKPFNAGSTAIRSNKAKPARKGSKLADSIISMLNSWKSSVGDRSSKSQSPTVSLVPDTTTQSLAQPRQVVNTKQDEGTPIGIANDSPTPHRLNAEPNAPGTPPNHPGNTPETPSFTCTRSQGEGGKCSQQKSPDSIIGEIDQLSRNVKVLQSQLEKVQPKEREISTFLKELNEVLNGAWNEWNETGKNRVEEDEKYPKEHFKELLQAIYVLQLLARDISAISRALVNNY
ncbi:hypothetical protein V5O48_015330 [Marasmius crinis-equi]|uniref:Uncharacterized protein n=1 Tax=Marasmius crinis-equi TaxID=585013 RepID=A0ABR3EUT9_9AGAR